MKLKFADFFCGAGGFHLGMRFYAQCVFACDIDKHARKTYTENFIKDDDIKIWDDIRTIDLKDLPDFDILCAGFPCQPFSIAGKREGFDHETQGNLFFKLMDIIKEKKPRLLFLENVKNLVSHDGGYTFGTILRLLEEKGYHVKHKVMNTKNYANIPQNRERVFIVGFKSKKAFDRFDFPKENALNMTLINMLEGSVDKSFYQTNPTMVEGVVKSGVAYQFRRSYIRENMSGVFPTLTANMGTGGNNVPLVKDAIGVRKLTPRECFNLQGFPVWFKLPTTVSNSQLYKQAGNSVTVPMVTLIADNIIKAYSGEK